MLIGFVNAEITAPEYGFAYAKNSFDRMEEFRRLERGTGEKGRGLW